MNPTLSELLIGNLVTLSEPPPPESAGDFMGGKIAVIGMLSFLCAQEAEKGAAVRASENEHIRAVFSEAATDNWAPGHSALLAELARGRDADLRLSALDQSNAELRRALIALQTAVEDDPSPSARPREKRLMALLVEAAQARALVLPGQPG
jgi:hypothetical protein